MNEESYTVKRYSELMLATHGDAVAVSILILAESIDRMTIALGGSKPR